MVMALLRKPSPVPDYSVWLVPDRDSKTHHRLQEVITDCAEAHEDAPEFDPHITLVGGINGEEASLADTTRRLASRCGPLSVSFARVHCSTTRYQCVFLLVEPTMELLSLHQTASQAFGMAEGMYVPHLSLVYSDMSVQDRFETVAAIQAESLPETVKLSTIELVNTSGEVSEWESVASYSL